ncbi:serine/threonine protein kinase [Terracidiphilus gabretensis]|uniref:serine/threonine protein kinase n=1 Tax=Terracidiphilus gabretensis TaxID=1577687 RepID=UPI00071B4F3E|nr:serine/threonine-protein kinase [Terracidiphilus gabretensis]
MPQDSENWTLLQKLFHLAEETSAEDRERVLTQHCADEALVRRAMEIFRNSAVLEAGAQERPRSAGPARIGPYTVIRLLGSGGIGTVYLAERIVGSSPQRVALKMLAPHAAGPSFVERFHREQHILATLDHSHITRLLDAGMTESNQPFLVMDYVEGEQLDAYCDARKLGIDERLRLFLQVCDAVAYAHRSLIVHLDLKPSNILVSNDGIVKLLDFGTSKLIQTDGLFTTTMLATPAYASPEQLRNEPVTTACDVYSLGAILFELLCGRRPHANSSVAAMIERAITEQNPESLLYAVTVEGSLNRGLSEARLKQILSGDLQTIVGKCLQPKPPERYASVDALMQDMNRYLDGKPVLARPQTAFYRLGKFVRRHRAGVAASIVAVLLLIGSVSYAIWRQEQALREAQRALSMQTFMSSLFTMANSQYSGRPTMSVNEFLNLGIKVLPLYIHNAADLRMAKDSLAQSLLVNGDTEDAQKVFAESERTAHMDGDKSAETEALTYEGEIAAKRGNLNQYLSLSARALDLSRSPEIPPSIRTIVKKDYAFFRDDHGPATDENLKLLRESVQESKDAKLSPSNIGNAIYDLASDLEERGQIDEAEALLKESIQYYSQDPAYVCNMNAVVGDLGFINLLRGNVNDSLVNDQRAYEGAVHCKGPESDDAVYQQTYLAQALTLAGRYAESIPMLEKIVAIRETEPGKKDYREEPLTFLATAYESAGRYTDAEKAMGQVFSLNTEMGEDKTGRVFGNYNYIYAKALAGQHRDAEALTHAQIADKLLGQTHPSRTPTGKQRDVDAHQLLLDLEARLGKTAGQP